MSTCATPLNRKAFCNWVKLVTFSKGCHMLRVFRLLCVLTLKAWHLVHSICVRLLHVVNRNAVHAQPSSAGCRKQMASLALYLAKRRPISFPTKDVRTSLPLHTAASSAQRILTASDGSRHSFGDLLHACSPALRQIASAQSCNFTDTGNGSLTALFRIVCRWLS